MGLSKLNMKNYIWRYVFCDETIEVDIFLLIYEDIF